MKKFYLIILFAFLASFGSYITAAEKTITYTFTTKDWNATDQEGNQANWTSGKAATKAGDYRGIAVEKTATRANATSPTSFNNIKKVELIWGTSKNGAGDIVLTVGGTDQTAKKVSPKQQDQSYAVTFDTPVNGYVKFTVTCTGNTIYIKSVAVTYEEAAADQVATPKFDVADGYSSFEPITASATTTTKGAIVHYSYTKGDVKQTLDDDTQAPVLSAIGTYEVTAFATDDTGTLKPSNPVTATYIITAPAVPTAEPKPGTYSEATIIKFTSPEGTIVRVKRGNEYFTPVKNIFTKELTAVGGEKTTYTFEVWTEYNDNNSDRVFYTYIIDPSYVPDSYTLCTDIKYLTPGTKVIFVGSKTDDTECKVMTDFDGSSSIRNADGTNVVVSGNTLDNIGNAVVFTVAYDGSATDNYKYSFYDDSESNYLGSGTSAKNTMSNQTAEGGIIPDKAKWSISLDAVNYYNATIEAKGYFTDNDKIDYPFLRYNSGSPRFACYRSKFASGLLRIYFNAKTSGVEKVALTDKKAKVYGANGNIVVEAETAADVNVYNAAGMLVATQKVGAGRTNIALAKGFYVVRAGNTVTKVAVR